MNATGHVPAALLSAVQWIVWRRETRKGKPTKVPYDVRTGQPGDVTDPAIFMTHAAAIEAAAAGGYDGIGFALTTEDPFVGVDLDRCIHEDGGIDDWAMEIVNDLPTYWEITPSGRGLRAFAKGTLPPKGRRKGQVEIYSAARFLTFTGDQLGGSADDVAECSEGLARVHARCIAPPKRKTGPGPSASLSLADEAIVAKCRRAKNSAKFERLYDHGDVSGYTSESEAVFALLGILAFYTDDGAQLERIMGRSGFAGEGRKWSERADYRGTSIANALTGKLNTYSPSTTGRNGLANGHHGGNGIPPAYDGGPLAPAPERPEIVITTEEHEVIDKAVSAIASEPSVFQRCNVLVTVFRDVAAHKRREPDRPAGTPRIVALPNPRLRELLTKRARWLKLIKGEKGKWDMIPAHPTDWAVSGVAARGEWPEIRPITGVVESPTMRPDGSILDAPGWDEATGLLYEPNATFPNIPSSPDRLDAKRAADILLDLVGDFPFVDQSHAAAWLAALLTPLARFAIPGPCPLFLFDANTPGTGKSKLCDLIAILATGRVAVTADYPAKEEEMAKTLLSIALAADRMVLFDNVETGFAVGGRSLDRVLTSGMVKGRILGRLEMTPDLPVHTVFYATGNNLGLRGDALRRVIPCRVESNEERPEERRGFKYPDLLGHVRGERPRLAVAALTLLRAYIIAGRPDPGLTPMDYPAWCGLIRNAVHWAVGLDPCQPRGQLRENDPETNARRALVMGWKELPGSDRGVTVAEALKFLEDRPSEFEQLRDALMERARKDEMPSRKSIGMLLNANKGRVVNGFAIDWTDAGKNTKAWRIIPAGGGTGGTGGTSQGPHTEVGSGESNRGNRGIGTSVGPTTPTSPTADDPMPYDPEWANLDPFA